MIEKLRAHYGFERVPFGRNLAPGMLHRHDSHNQDVARISWYIAERSIGVVSGEVGAGKTVSVRTCLDALDPSKYSVVYIPNPMIGVRIQEAIVNTFGQIPSHLGSRLTVQTGRVLLAEREERGRTPVLVVRRGPSDVLRTAEIHPHAHQPGHGPGLPAVLPAGRPAHPRTHHETRCPGRPGTARRPALHDAGHDSTETTSYVAHHLKIAGRPDQLFTEDALTLIHTTSRGYPGAVNNLSLLALVAAFATGKNLVDEAAARASVSEVVGD
ncbi:ExeA family protein [Streptomyces europaeiscabiei]|uniref:ExeA family protein n=1 Tax=Streptomyces europaeiscabiei TaxID=146819 RepID=UPI0038F80669